MITGALKIAGSFHYLMKTHMRNYMTLEHCYKWDIKQSDIWEMQYQTGVYVIEDEMFGEETVYTFAFGGKRLTVEQVTKIFQMWLTDDAHSVY